MRDTEKFGLDLEGAIHESDMGERIESLEKSVEELMQEHKSWIKTAGKDGSQLDLSGFDLRSVENLKDVPLTAIKAVAAIFVGQNLRKASMQSAIFDEADFRDCNLEGADLRGSSFKHVQMTRAQLQGVKSQCA